MEEAKRRGLANLRSTPEAVKEFIAPKNVALFVKHGVLTETEIQARYEIQLENYVKTLHIEALTMLEMAKRDILPSVMEYSATVYDLIIKKEAVGLNSEKEKAMAKELSDLTAALSDRIDSLEATMENLEEDADALAAANYYRDVVYEQMNRLRATADKLETIVSSKYWPMPTYSDLLFRV